MPIFSSFLGADEAFGGSDIRRDDLFHGSGEASSEDLDQEIDAELAEIEAGIDQDAYGAYGGYGAGPGGALSAPAGSAGGEDDPVIAEADVNPDGSTALSAAFEPDVNDVNFVKWYRSVIPEFLGPDFAGEGHELAKALSRMSAFRAWVLAPSSLSTAQKGDILSNLFKYNAVFNRPDALQVGWETLQASVSKLSRGEIAEAMVSAVSGSWETWKTWMADDVWPAIKAALPGADEQNINKLAIIYWLGHKYREAGRQTWGRIPGVDAFIEYITNYIDKYDEIIGEIDAGIAAGRIRATGISPAPAAPAYSPPPVSWSDPLEEVAAGTGVEGVRPQTVLAVGYGLIAGAALLGLG